MPFVSAFMITAPVSSYINSCDNCDIAWLYKDAHQFGLDAYKGLVHEGNVICPDVGPILETDDPNFIAQMDSCPCKCLQISYTILFTKHICLSVCF